MNKGHIDKLVKDAETSRKKDFEKEDDGEFIEINDEIYKLLKLTPVFNSKKKLFIILTHLT